MRRHLERDKYAKKYTGVPHVSVLRREEPRDRPSSKRRKKGPYQVVWEEFRWPIGGRPGHYELVHIKQADRCLQGRCNAGVNPVIFGPAGGESYLEAQRRKRALNREHPNGPELSH